VIPLKNGTKSAKIMLNVCQSIIHHGAMCPIKSGACLDDPEKPNRLVLASRSFIKIECNTNI